MSGVPDRDLRLGRAAFQAQAPAQESSARRMAELYAQGTNPPSAAQNAAIQWLGAASMWLTLRAFDRAADAWLEALSWGSTAHGLLLGTAGEQRAAQSLHTPLSLATVARAADAVAELIAPHPPRSPHPHPWGRLLLPLSAGDDEGAREAAAAYEREVPADQAVRRPALPRLGSAVIALLDRDGAAFDDALEAVRAAREHFVRRGHLKGQTAGLLCLEALTLWRLARDRDLDPTLDERYAAVPVRFLVTSGIEFEGAGVRRQPFLWPVDLLPTGFLGRFGPPG